MAAPSSWGNEASGYGRIGISVNVTYPSATTASVSIEVWISTKYSATDSNNNFWFDDNAQAASTSRGSRSIKTTINSGAWNTGNYQRIYTYPTFTVNRTTGNQTRYCAAKLSGVEIASGTMTHMVSYTINALDSYDISYSPNGMSCTVPATHKKYYGINTTVSATIPTTEGYTCTGWVTDAAHGYKLYTFGATYTANEPIVLFANWVKNKYKIVLNPNDGTFYPDGGIIGSVTAQIVEFEKEHGASCVLPTPVRANYNFLGWSASPSTNTVSYVPGASYTANTPVTLYAVWELAYIPPIIRNVVIQRSDIDGSPTDEGAHFNVSFEWETDKNFSNEDGTIGAKGTRIVIKAFGSNGYFAKLGVDDDPEGKVSFSISDFSGNFNKIGVGPPGDDGIGPISTECSYTVFIEVFDSTGKSTLIERSIMPIAYPIDILKEGKGIAFGKPASESDTMDVNFKAKFNKTMIFSTEAKQALLDIFYPVNSIYISYSDDKSPAELFGGEWIRIQDRFLYGTAVGGVYKIGTEAGEAQHYLTEAEMPKHTHTDIFYRTAEDVSKKVTLNTGSTGYRLDWTANSGNGTDNELKTGYAGGGNQQVGLGEAHNNMPPFVAVAIWRRTA